MLKVLNLTFPETMYDRYEIDGEAVCVSIDPKNRWVAIATSSGKVDIRKLDEMAEESPLPENPFKTISAFNRIT